MSIETLPVEILHRIFDNLDAQTILLSIRPLCRLFRAVVKTYDRYVFDFKSISKTDFHLLCRLINPQNVRSLTLCDNEHTPNEIALFISMVRLRQFTRLHSITLLGIEEIQLNMILKSINLNLLTSFSLDIRKYDDRRRKTTLHFLSFIMAQSSLRKIELNIKNDRIANITWPLNCRIEYLTINEHIDFNDLYKILSCSPQLHTLIIKTSLFNMINNTLPTTSCFSQIISLTIEELDVTNDKLQTFLLLTPSLIYLKLIGKHVVFNGKQWEEFIQINLLQLDKFEFFIDAPILDGQTQDTLDAIIQSFRSPFWIEYKKWFVACEFNTDPLNSIQLYSIPICKSVLQYQLNTKKVFGSTSTILSYNDPLIVNNINELILPLKISANINIKKEELTKNSPLFPKVTKLQINVDRIYPLKSLQLLESIIDISRLVEVKLESYYFSKHNQKLLFNVVTMIEQSCHLSSLIIHSRFCKFAMYPYLNDLCSIIPRQIKHLQIPINQLGQIQTIFQRCSYLSVVQFEITRSNFSTEVIQWFTQNTIDSTFRRHSGCDIIWIGKKTTEISLNHKRMKLTDDNELEC